jgi:hypothetical protein
MIFGFGLSDESLMPADAECSKRATLENDEVDPSGKRSPLVISFPIDMIERGTELLAKVLETASV